MWIATPATLLHTARVRAHLTQRDLAKRAGTAQSVVARIELGLTSPSYSTLSALFRAAGFELHMQLQTAPVCDSHMLDDVARIQGLPPEERLSELGNASRFFASAERV